MRSVHLGSAYFVNPLSLTVCFSGQSDSGETDAVKTTKLENWYVSYDPIQEEGYFGFVNALHLSV